MLRVCGSLVLIALFACSETGPGQDLGSTTRTLCRSGGDCCPTPILFDLAGDGVALTAWDDGVDFTFKPFDGKSRTAWTIRESDDAWLVLDRNGNGSVDDGAELFGNFTPQPPMVAGGKRGNGFAALAELDTTWDGRVDARDPAFDQLRLWQDRNHDGVSQKAELSRLTAHGIDGVSVLYRELPDVDIHGNRFLYAADVYTVAGSAVQMTAWDVVLVSTLPEPGFAAVALARPQEEEADDCGAPPPPSMQCTTEESATNPVKQPCPDFNGDGRSDAIAMCARCDGNRCAFVCDGAFKCDITKICGTSIRLSCEVSVVDQCRSYGTV